MKKCIYVLLVCIVCVCAGCTPGDGMEGAEYGAWTASDWEAASDGERALAAEYALVAVGASTREEIEEAHGDETAEAQLEEDIGIMVFSIGLYFADAPESADLNDLIREVNEEVARS